jgi:hypothetical protein
MEEWLNEENPQSEFLILLGDKLYLHVEAEVHHLDEDKGNNRRRNLMVTWKPIHIALHNGIMPEPGTYWPTNAKIKLGKPRGFVADRINH